MEFNAVLTSELKALSQRHGTTLYMTVLAGWASMLGHLAGQDEVVIGSPVANRAHPDLDPVIGFFANTVAIRVKLPAQQQVDALLAQVKRQPLNAQAHQDLPFEQVVEALELPRSLACNPLFQVMLAWQNTPAAPAARGRARASTGHAPSFGQV